MPRWLALILTCLICTGCHFGTPPDPNNPNTAGMLQPEVLRRALKGASDALMVRVRRGEISDEEFRALIAESANNILESVEIKRIPPQKAWEYGDIFRTARRWEDALKAYEVAVKNAKDEDRRVNDSLHLAHVLMEMGKTEQAIKMARSVFNTPDTASAPILPAVLLEIVPAGKGKGHELELAKLLEDAIACHSRTIVDPKAQSGRDFLMARPFHIRNAWKLVVGLYDRAGKQDMADAAFNRGEAMLRQYAGL